MPRDPDDVRLVKEKYRRAPWLAFQHGYRNVLAEIELLDSFYGRDFGIPLSRNIRQDKRLRKSMMMVGGIPRYLAPLGGRIFQAVSECRRVHAIGANRSAKTMSGAILVACFAHGINEWMEMPKPPVQVWACFPDWTNHGQPITYKMLKWALGSAGVQWKKQDRLFLVCSHVIENGVPCRKCEEPSEVYLKSYESGSDKHQGGAPALIWNDEAPTQDIWEEHSARIGGQHPLQILQTLTPLRPAAWIYSELYQPWLDAGEPDTAQFLGSTIDENPFLTVEEIDEFKAAYKHDPEQLEVRTKGTWAMTSGAVYPMLDVDVHVIEDFPIPGVHFWPKDEKEEIPWTLYRGFDPGIRNPTAVVWAAVDVFGRVFVYREAELKGMSIPKVMKAIYAAETPHEHRRGFRRTVIDPAAKQRDLVTGIQRLTEYQKHGLHACLGNNDREIGIDKMKQAFDFEKDEEGNFSKEPKYRFFRSCVRIWITHRKYSWLPHNPNSPRGPRDDAQKKDDDLVDCARYLEASYGGPIFHHPDDAVVVEDYQPEDATTGY